MAKLGCQGSSHNAPRTWHRWSSSVPVICTAWQRWPLEQKSPARIGSPSVMTLSTSSLSMIQGPLSFVVSSLEGCSIPTLPRSTRSQRYRWHDLLGHPFSTKSETKAVETSSCPVSACHSVSSCTNCFPAQHLDSVLLGLQDVGTRQ